MVDFVSPKGDIALPPANAGDAFFLDVDGTLLEIAATPSEVSVDAGLIDVLRRLHGFSGGAVAIISGRRIADVDALLAGLCLPVAGQHGLERRDAGGGIHRHRATGVNWRRLAAQVRDALAGIDGLIVEDKGMTVAVHFRLNPAAETRVAAELARIVAGVGAALCLQPGRCVLEIKPSGRDKGTAIAEFMAEAPFRGRRPLFLGDDVTDEYGFRVINGLGGDSIKVGDGDSVAHWRLEGVAAVRAWLEGVVSGAGWLTTGFRPQDM